MSDPAASSTQSPPAPAPAPRKKRSALDVLRSAQDPIDLLITDIVMPRMDGPSLIKVVRETRPNIKVICISGYAEDGFRKRIAANADIHFLPKPFSLNQLAGKVKEVMGRAEAS